MNEKVLKIAQLAMEINAKTDYCAFFGFSGHVNCINVTVYESKEDVTNSFKIYDAFLVSISYEKRIEKTIEDLEALIEKGLKEDLHELGA